MINNFPEMNQKIVKEYIVLPLLSCLKSIQWQKYRIGLGLCVKRIHTRTYHNFTIDKGYFQKDFIVTRRNDMRMTCSALY